MVTLTFVSLISRDTLLCHKQPLFFKHFFFKNYLSSRQFTKHVFNCHYEFNVFPLLLTLQTGEKGSLLSTQTTVSWTTVRPGAHIFWQRVLLMTCTFVSSRMSGEIATSKRIVIVHYKDFIFFIYWAWDWQFLVLKFCFYLFCITLFKSIKTLIVLHSYCSMDVILIINTSKYKQYFYLHNKLTCWSFKMTVPPACNITVLQSCSLSG